MNAVSVKKQKKKQNQKFETKKKHKLVACELCCFEFELIRHFLVSIFTSTQHTLTDKSGEGWQHCCGGQIKRRFFGTTNTTKPSLVTMG